MSINGADIKSIKIALSALGYTTKNSIAKFNSRKKIEGLEAELWKIKQLRQYDSDLRNITHFSSGMITNILDIVNYLNSNDKNFEKMSIIKTQLIIQSQEVIKV